MGVLVFRAYVDFSEIHPMRNITMRYTGIFVIAVALMIGTAFSAGADDWMDKVEHKFVDNNGVNIHYAKAGQGPLIVFIHGFPDFWYTWRNQMEGLAGEYTVVALDTRGYNKSDKPEGEENYAMPLLVSDVAAVIKSEGQDKAIITGHDWGGAIAWAFAMMKPQMTDKLIIVNLPHPVNLSRELANNEEQAANSIYARNFQKPDSHKMLSAEMLSSMVSQGDPDLKATYKAAFENSSFEAMMNYYRQNFPKPPYTENTQPMPKIQMPVLQFHGLADTALLAGGLNDTWNLLAKDYTLVTLPGIGHWTHTEAPDMVTDTMKWWLAMRK
ncbi:MAG: alpha/beta hydrolase [Candidatus Hydrogenedentota bacterium]|nr:MAG: alpha/beta hydrolase [Candidatus Hydrogenedentota bacterium]